MIAERYRLESRIGSGGMGEVWQARHVHLDRVVAVKLLMPEMRAAADRMLAEALALARVRHPAVVEVNDCGLIDGSVPYLVMERLEGETLAERLTRGPLPPLVAARHFVTILEGLEAAHRAGVVHRDLKPENIFLSRDAAGAIRPKLIDFGIALDAQPGAARQTEVGLLIGTPAYMSPEQFGGGVISFRSDVWSATVAFYEAMTGVPPFGLQPLRDVMRRVLESPVPYPRTGPPIDKRLWQIITAGLRKAPEERIASAVVLRDALAAWLEERGGDHEVAARADTVPAASSLVAGPARGSPAAPDSTPPGLVGPRAGATLDDLIRARLKGD